MTWGHSCKANTLIYLIRWQLHLDFFLKSMLSFVLSAIGWGGTITGWHRVVQNNRLDRENALYYFLEGERYGRYNNKKT